VEGEVGNVDAVTLVPLGLKLTIWAFTANMFRHLQANNY